MTARPAGNAVGECNPRDVLLLNEQSDSKSCRNGTSNQFWLTGAAGFTVG
jgi:hypothetical protein